MLVHHFVSDNEENTPVRHYQNVKVLVPELKGIRSPSLEPRRQGQISGVLSSSFLLLI